VHKFDKSFVITVIFMLMFLAAISAADKMLVFVSILPQKYFVQQIGKERVDVRVMVQPGSDAHAYEYHGKKANVVARENGGQVIFADPLACDWMANLQEVADEFAAART